MPSRRPTTTPPARPARSAQAQVEAVRAQRAALRQQLAESQRQAEQAHASAAREIAADGVTPGDLPRRGHAGAGAHSGTGR